MSWLDTYDYMSRARTSGYVGSAAGALQARQNSRSFFTSQAGYDPFRSSGRSTWGTLASGGFQRAKPKEEPPPFGGGRVKIAAPFSSSEKPAAPAPTHGDIFGSIGAAIGDTIGSGLNIANVVPWMQERIAVLSHDLGDVLEGSGIPVVSEIGGTAAHAVGNAYDVFLEGMRVMSNVVAPILDAPNTFVRDGILAVRAEDYRQFVATGKLNAYQRALLGTMGPEAQKQAKLVLGHFDLPDSVMRAIEANPEGDIKGYFDAAPEGRRWSYDDGVSGLMLNMVPTLMIYGAEYAAAGPLAGAARAGLIGGRTTLAVPAASAAPLASATRLERALHSMDRFRVPPTGGLAASMGGGRGAALTAGVRMGGSALSGIGTIQKAAMASGMVSTGVTTALDAMARYAGAEEAVRWFDNLNRSTAYSDDMHVQLVTGFTTNPFAAAGMARKGVIELAGGVGKVTVGRALGKQVAQLYDTDTARLDLLARMFRLPTREAAADLMARHGIAKEHQADIVLGSAVDVLVARLPKQEVAVIAKAFPDDEARLAYVLETYPDQINAILSKEPQAIAARWHDWNWNYHQFPGSFDPDVSAALAVDARTAAVRTAELRRSIGGAVIGYPEYLTPRMQVLVEDFIRRAPDDIPVAGIGGLQGLVKDFKPLRKYWQGLVTGPTVPKRAVEEMLHAAKSDYDKLLRDNPMRATRGVDPVLRRDSPHLIRDYADALGIDDDTVRAIQNYDPANPAPFEDDLLRRYLVAKVDMPAPVVQGMPPAEVWERASDHFDAMTKPWREAGDRVIATERELRAIEAQMYDMEVQTGWAVATQPSKARGWLDPVPEGMRAEYHDLSRRAAILRTLVDRANDPIEPYARVALQTQRIAGKAVEGAAADAILAERASQKVAAMRALDDVDAIDAQVASILKGSNLEGTSAWWSVLRRVDGAWTFSGGMPVVPRSIVTRIVGVAPRFGTRRASMSDEAIAAGARAELGDAALWRLIREHRYDAEFVRRLTKRDAARIDRVLSSWSKMPALGDLEGVADAEDILTQLGRLAEQRSGILEEATVHTVSASGRAVTRRPSTLARMRVPEEQMRLVDDADRFDPEWEVVVHPQNIERVRLATEAGAGDEILRVAAEDTEIRNAVMRLAAGSDLEAFVRDPANLAAIRKAVVPLDEAGEPWVAPTPGVVNPLTDLDTAIATRDLQTIRELRAKIADSGPPPVEPRRVTTDEAERLIQQAYDEGRTAEGQALNRATGIERGGTAESGGAVRGASHYRRRSSEYRRLLVNLAPDPRRAKMYGPTLSGSFDQTIWQAPQNDLGRRVLNFLNTGDPDRDIHTVGGLIAVMREIERGTGKRLGLGVELQAEAQRVARLVLDARIRRAKADLFEPGIFSKGTHPSLLSEDDLELARTLLRPDSDLIVYDPTDPLKTLQYGLKRPPKAALVQEWAQVPGLAEEFLSARFQTWPERVVGAQVRQVFNLAFGARSNQEIGAAIRSRFIDRLARQGVDPEHAASVWTRWQELAAKSREPQTIRGSRGGYKSVLGDNPLYASVANIPGNRLMHEALAVVDETPGLPADYADVLRSVRYDVAFREAGSFTRRNLADHFGTLGDALAATYGAVMHNKVATTYYYLYRFAMDLRFRAMEFVEGPILAAGRSMFKPREIDEGLLGMTRTAVHRLSDDPLIDTSYPFSRSRFDQAYRVMLKEQPGVLAGKVKGLTTENPEKMVAAIRQMAETDPELVDLRILAGSTPGESVLGQVTAEEFVGALDRWYDRILRSVDIDMTVDDALADALARSPELAQVYGKLANANKELWSGVKATFFGNPERSLVERTLNSWLLFWPISYQVKATKWLLHVMYDRAGGLPTNAGGAVALDRMIDMHRTMLVEDDAYARWFEEHPTLVFAAQMFMPITPGDVGVSLNPVLRTAFFGASKGLLDMGPVYTAKLVGQTAVELWPDLGAIPGMDLAYRLAAGRQEPELDTARFGS